MIKMAREWAIGALIGFGLMIVAQTARKHR